MIFISTAHSDELPQPQGKVLLTVSGSISHTNGNGEARFDRNMLTALGISELTTTTPWTHGEPVFEGVMAQKLLEAVGPTGDEIVAYALNDYTTTIPLSDFKRYPVLLALKMNGETLKIRDRGPIWIVYPYSQYPELDSPLIRRRWVWQLQSIQIDQH